MGGEGHSGFSGLGNNDALDSGLQLPPAKIKRKPVPSPMLLPQQSRRVTRPINRQDDEGYVAVNKDDTEHHCVAGTPALLDLDRTLRFRRAFALWKWELVSLITSVAAFIAIIIILRVYEDQDTASWKSPVSINAIIAVLSALFKGSLILPISSGLSQLKWLWFLNQYQSLADMDLYDRASRGAWGSVVFIARQLCAERMSFLATFGASLTLITLAVDPFSQASVFINSCERASLRLATIPRANNYSLSEGHTGAGLAELDSPMQNAVLTGLYQPPVNSSVSISTDVACSTGNCTFPAENGASFATLTMCHSCLDISNRVKKADNNTYSLTGYGYDLTIASDMFVGSEVVFNTTASDGMPNRDITQPFPDGPWNITSLADFQGLALAQKNQSCDGYCEIVPFAFDCSLRPCVKTFAANVSNGIYHEQELSREYLHLVPVSYFFQLAVKRAFFNGTWKDCEGAKDKSDRHTVQVTLPEAMGLGYNDQLPTVWYPTECTYHVGQLASSAIAQYIGGLFDHAVLKTYPGHVIRGDGWLKSLYRWGKINISSVDVLAEGLATSVGVQMRRLSDFPSNESGVPREIWTSVQGQVLHMRPCIQVRWKPLSFLAILLMAELLFFALVVIVSYRSSWDGDWKSSTLPLLFQKITTQGFRDKEDRPDESEKALNKIAKPLKAMFGQFDGLWRLSTEMQREDTTQYTMDSRK